MPGFGGYFSRRGQNTDWSPPTPTATNRTASEPIVTTGRVRRGLEISWGPPSDSGTPAANPFYDRTIFQTPTQPWNTSLPVTQFWEPPAEIATPSYTPYEIREFITTPIFTKRDDSYRIMWESPRTYSVAAIARRRCGYRFLS